MWKTRCFIALLAVLSMIGGYGQENLIIEGVVMDGVNYEAMPYVTVHVKGKNTGTLTNVEGVFKLEGLAPSDVVVCSYIGYESVARVASMFEKEALIFMKPSTQLLAQATILGDNRFLYDVVSKCATTKTYATREAKTFYELESFVDGNQQELYQSYNNGVYRGYDVDELNMKNSRIALAVQNERLFISTETSRAILLHKMFARNELFPGSPFELGKRKLKKQYTLSLGRKYKDASDRTIYHIMFEPRKEERLWFAGEAWVDSASQQLVKVNLNCPNARRQPFRLASLHFGLDRIDLRIAKTFDAIEGKAYTRSVDFDYNTEASDNETGEKLSVRSRAVLYAYDYDSTFVLPTFDFPEISYRDYVLAQLIPYNPKFWECTREFRMDAESAETRSFLESDSTFSDQALFSSYVRGSSFFERPFIPWTGNRIQFRDLRKDSSQTSGLYDIASIPSQQYNLSIHLFMDVNILCDSLEYKTMTIMDPYRSYYDFEPTPEGGAFLNIWFDLAEIKRRELHERLTTCSTYAEALRIHQEVEQELEAIGKRYFKEVQRGQNLEALKAWNARTMGVFGIDNIAWFGLDQEGKE